MGIQVLLITFLIMNQIIPMYQVNPETNVLEEGTIKVLATFLHNTLPTFFLNIYNPYTDHLENARGEILLYLFGMVPSHWHVHIQHFTHVLVCQFAHMVPSQTRHVSFRCNISFLQRSMGMATRSTSTNLTHYYYRHMVFYNSSFNSCQETNQFVQNDP